MECGGNFGQRRSFAGKLSLSNVWSIGHKKWWEFFIFLDDSELFRQTLRTHQASVQLHRNHQDLGGGQTIGPEQNHASSSHHGEPESGTISGIDQQQQAKAVLSAVILALGITSQYELVRQGVRLRSFFILSFIFSHFYTTEIHHHHSDFFRDCLKQIFYEIQRTSFTNLLSISLARQKFIEFSLLHQAAPVQTSFKIWDRIFTDSCSSNTKKQFIMNFFENLKKFFGRQTDKTCLILRSPPGNDASNLVVKALAKIAIFARFYYGNRWSFEAFRDYCRDDRFINAIYIYNADLSTEEQRNELIKCIIELKEYNDPHSRPLFMLATHESLDSLDDYQCTYIKDNSIEIQLGHEASKTYMPGSGFSLNPTALLHFFLHSE